MPDVRTYESGNFSLTVGDVCWVHLEVGVALTVSPDDLLPPAPGRVGEYPAGGDPET